MAKKFPAKILKPLPKKIMVMGKEFDVRYTDNLHDEDRQELYGETHGREFRININTKYSYEAQRITLFHEAIHAALSVSGLTHLLTEKLEEALVSAIESSFADAVDVYALTAPEVDKKPKTEV